MKFPATADECRLPPWLVSPMCVIRPPSDGGSRSTSTVAGALIVWCEAPYRRRTNVGDHRGWASQCVV